MSASIRNSGVAKPPWIDRISSGFKGDYRTDACKLTYNKEAEIP